MRQSKQARIDVLERSLGYVQEELRAERSNLSQITTENENRYSRILAERNHYMNQAQYSDRLLKVIENLSSRIANAKSS